MNRYVLSILLSLALWSCSLSGRVGSTLSEAESLMENHPDSALALLSTIDPSEIHGKSARALHALLLTQAQFKNYCPPANDSLISIARDYYESSSDSYRKMLSLYYFGRVRLNSKDYSKSLYSLIKAKDLAENLDDDFWVAMCAQRIADIYHDTFNYNEEIKYTRIEYDRFLKAGKDAYIDCAVLDLAHSYYSVEKYDSCLLLCRQLQDTVLRHSDDDLRLDVGRAMGLCNFVQDNYEEARDIYEEICRMDEANVSDSAYLGLTYLRLGNFDESKRILKSLSDIESGVGVWLRYSYYAAVDSTDKALSSLKVLDSDSERIMKELVNHDLSGALMDYHDYERRITDAELRNHKLVIAMILVTALSVCVVSFILFSRYRRRQKILVERNVEIAQNLREMIAIKDSQAQATIHNLLAERFAVLDNLCRILYEKGNSSLARRQISNEIDSLVRQFSTDEAKLTELGEYVNLHYEGIIDRLRNDFPDMKESDYRLFICSILGFSNSVIAMFLGEEKITAVYARRKRLKAKFKASESQYKDEYIKVLS